MKRFVLSTLLLFAFGCAPPNLAASLLIVDANAVQLGIENAGKFESKTDKTFSNKDKIVVKFNAKGLVIKSGKIKVNIDVILKKDKEILGIQNDIFGEKGETRDITGVSKDYSGIDGSSEITLSITPPPDLKGELVANITLRDLNSESKLSTIETKFVLK